jgi:TonB family protein
MKKGIISSLFISSLFAPLAFSQSEQGLDLPEPVKLSTVINAEPIERKGPKYPANAARRNQEGWVQVSFVIDEEGNVKDPIVHDSSGIRAFEKAAMNAVKKWRYDPATRDGKPIEQCDSKVQLDFKLGGQGNVVSRKFKKLYMEIETAIENKDLEKAGELLAELKDRDQRTLAESTHLAVISAMYQQQVGDTQAFFADLWTIKNIGHEYLSSGSYLIFAHNLYSILVERKKYSEAVELYNDIVDRYSEEEELQWFNSINAKVQGYLVGRHKSTFGGARRIAGALVVRS